eukprot:CAMPEP_0170852410 /NCGR_PEP_ID=MMETSP0734-20130129/11845_1 /TAXON_ID=186038 /ORGANISM="Fragilariopsis kerguelensis, Strain L26-C5" /LENGTH=66 /DNA_ID=CAMNT_0011222781 /DNA_START=166 /DNA_END=366 /DNA_ORIENTATION=+
MKANEKENQTEVIIPMIYLFLISRSITITWVIICLLAGAVGAERAAADAADAAEAGAALIIFRNCT